MKGHRQIRNQFAAIAFASLLFPGLSGAAHAATYVAPGDQGTISLPIYHYELTPRNLPLTVLSISTQGPSYFRVLGTSDLSIPFLYPATTHMFEIDYEITSATVTEAFNVYLNLLASNADVMTVPNAEGVIRSATVQFFIDTSSPTIPELSNAHGNPLANYVGSTNAVRLASTDDHSGMCSLGVSGPSFSSTVPFSGTTGEATRTAISNLAQGTYTVTAADCVGNSSTRQYYYATMSSVDNIIIYGTMDGTEKSERGAIYPNDPDDNRVQTGTMTVLVRLKNAAGDPTSACAQVTLTVNGAAANCAPDGADLLSQYAIALAKTAYFQVKNTSNTANTKDIQISWKLEGNNPDHFLIGSAGDAIFRVADGFQLSPGEVMLGSVTVKEFAQGFASSTTSFSATTNFSGVQAVWYAACNTLAALASRQVISLVGPCADYFKSEVAFVDPALVTFNYVDPGGSPAVSTSTLKVYGWTGSSWTLTGITQLGVSKSTSTGVIIASATIVRSGVYATLFSVSDASAPLTTLSVQGSTSGFAGVVMYATGTYAVLQANDPLVSGFASGVATTYYRLDGSSASAFGVYGSSLAFLPGTHVLQYYAVDWAGNIEPVKTATFTVTPTGFTRLSADARVDGWLLVGESTSGPRLEVEAVSADDPALLVSSPDLAVMFAADNYGNAAAGGDVANGMLTVYPAGGRGLELSAGNSTASVASAQIAFGWNGTAERRHTLWTQHNASTVGNRMGINVYTPDAGVALASMTVVQIEGMTALSGASVHVRPAGTPDAELEISNGVTPGGGTLHRAQAWVTSSRKLKKEIRYLTRQEERRALDDLLSLKPVHFRYRRALKGVGFVDDPASMLRRGYVLEDSPVSIRHGAGLDTLERIANVEMAVKESLRKLERLEEELRPSDEERSRQ